MPGNCLADEFLPNTDYYLQVSWKVLDEFKLSCRRVCDDYIYRLHPREEEPGQSKHANDLEGTRLLYLCYCTSFGKLFRIIRDYQWNRNDSSTALMDSNLNKTIWFLAPIDSSYRTNTTFRPHRNSSKTHPLVATRLKWQWLARADGYFSCFASPSASLASWHWYCCPGAPADENCFGALPQRKSLVPCWDWRSNITTVWGRLWHDFYAETAQTSLALVSWKSLYRTRKPARRCRQVFTLIHSASAAFDTITRRSCCADFLNKAPLPIVSLLFETASSMLDLCPAYEVSPNANWQSTPFPLRDQNL